MLKLIGAPEENEFKIPLYVFLQTFQALNAV